jgi:hypothetical protein
LKQGSAERTQWVGESTRAARESRVRQRSLSFGARKHRKIFNGPVLQPGFSFPELIRIAAVQCNLHKSRHRSILDGLERQWGFRSAGTHGNFSHQIALMVLLNHKYPSGDNV